MKQNVGKTDKIIRLIIGLLAIVLGYTISPWFYWVAIVSLITASIGFCGIYKVFGISTCPVPATQTPQTPPQM